MVRFQVLVQKATKVCQEVKSLGNNLLSAIEKHDNEALAILRAKHERVILELVETVRYGQWQEAIKTREGLETSLMNAVQTYTYYERLLGEAVFRPEYWNDEAIFRLNLSFREGYPQSLVIVLESRSKNRTLN